MKRRMYFVYEMFFLFLYICAAIGLYYQCREREININMTTGEIITCAVSIVGVLGFICTIVQQIVFYKRDSKTMDRIENGVNSGKETLNSRMESEHQKIIDKIDGKENNLMRAINDVDKRLIAEFAEQRAKRDYLRGNETVLQESVENLSVFVEVMGELKRENVELREHCHRLEENVKYLRKELDKEKNLRKRPNRRMLQRVNDPFKVEEQEND